MGKNFLNYHRYRRKWGRKIEQVKHDFSSEEPAGVHRDFAWRSRKRNPFVLDDPHALVKRRVLLSVFALCLAAIVGLGLFHPFFFISRISIEGQERIPKHEIEKAVVATMEYRRLFVFPARGFFVVNVDEIRDVLKSRFPLSTVEVKKTFPHNLSVVMKEKISTVIYDNGKQYSYVGLDGKIVEVLRAVGPEEWQRVVRVVSSTTADGTVEAREEVISSTHTLRPVSIKKEMGDYPIVYDMRLKDGGVNSDVLQPETVRGIVSWFQFLSSFSDIPFGYIELQHELGDAIIYTSQGWHIKINVLEQIEEQFSALKIVLSKQVDRGVLQYVDVRYPGKVYWQ